MTTMNATPHSLDIELRFLIGGEAITADKRRSLSVINPATCEEIGRLPIATDEDLRAALDSAALGFARWRGVSPYDRAIVLRKAAGLIRERAAQASSP